MVHVSITKTLPNFTGQLIDDGRYQLLNLLGSGAYGMVYRAVDNTSPVGNPIYLAIKCLHKHEIGTRHDDLQIREFALHSKVAIHPNIITIHKILSDDLYVYVVMDLCTGGDLFAAITEKRLYHNNSELVKVAFVQLLDAVHFCHNSGVFHRDIKPENVLCTKSGSGILLADFGLSTENRISKDLGCGSSYYMSPECIGKETALGKYSTRHSDIWSLGIILTNMISGRNPWRYATTQDDCFAAYVKNPDFLRDVLPISDAANKILKRIFVLNPLSRISLPELREEVLKIDTFFMSEDEIAKASDFVRSAAETYATAPAPVISNDIADVASAFFDTNLFSGSASASKDASKTPGAVHEFAPAPIAEPVPVRAENFDDGSVSLINSIPSSGGSGSGVESDDGPITPATHPADPSIEVPEFLEGESMQQSAAYPAVAGYPTFNHHPAGAAGKPSSRRSQLFRMAVHRLKAMSAT